MKDKSLQQDKLQTDFHLISDEFYRLLVTDYINDGNFSVIYTHYLSELEESIRKYKADLKKSNTPKKLSAIDAITLEYRKLAEDASPDAQFAFLDMLFGMFAIQPSLYDHAIYVYAREDDVAFDDAVKNMGKLNDKQDFLTILEVLDPFLSAGLGLSETDRTDLKIKNKKSLLRQRVKDLSDLFSSEPAQLKCAFSKAKLLNGKSNQINDKIRNLYDHVLSRSIDKAFKDYLYSCGYHMFRPGSGDANAVSVQKIQKGRSGAKPDKTLKLLTDICRKNGVRSLLPGTNIDSPEFVRLANLLYTELSAQMSASDRHSSLHHAPISIILDVDARTGNSLHIVGRYYFDSLLHALSKNRSSQSFRLTDLDVPCVFVIMNRHADGDALSYEAYSNDSDASLLLYDSFSIAKREYKRLSAETFQEILDLNASLRHGRFSADTLTAFGQSLPLPFSPEEDLRRETMEYIATPYPDELP
ncbi:MAG: hypothetical protein IJ794_00975 [Lachnospiraceae bacterium]|nr:hypothetical protein [Lachnospiraceae bacterium]